MFISRYYTCWIFCATDGQYVDGDVRLVGGSYQWEGRVEVFMSGVWGTITDSVWTDEDATVVCWELGYREPGIILILDLHRYSCQCLFIEIWIMFGLTKIIFLLKSKHFK